MDNPGPTGLVGSGEFLSCSDVIDRALLERVTRRSRRAVILPTAAGREGPTSVGSWLDKGVAHLDRFDSFRPGLTASIVGSVGSTVSRRRSSWSPRRRLALSRLRGGSLSVLRRGSEGQRGRRARRSPAARRPRPVRPAPTRIPGRAVDPDDPDRGRPRTLLGRQFTVSRSKCTWTRDSSKVSA